MFFRLRVLISPLRSFRSISTARFLCGFPQILIREDGDVRFLQASVGKNINDPIRRDGAGDDLPDGMFEILGASRITPCSLTNYPEQRRRLDIPRRKQPAGGDIWESAGPP